MKIFFSEKCGIQDRAVFVRLKVFRLKLACLWHD
jgi:hypothetical protein